MIVRFWGVRGSIPCPGPKTVRYGGNTSCIELAMPEVSRRIIIDAGSGIRELGAYILNEGTITKQEKIKIFLTHTHWDHIMGFPFFAPMYMPDAHIQIFGPRASEKDSLEEIVGGQWTYNYFPVLQKDLAATVEYIELKEGEYDLGMGLRLKTKLLFHPISCLGYRFEYKDKCFCTLFDTEPFKDRDEIIEFVKGADLIVHDAQYTEEEYRSAKEGWGHSYIEYALDIGIKAGAKRLAFFHHDPDRTDEELDNLGNNYNSKEIESFFAKEKQEVVL
ncbi:MAG: MBL fold metallo-hydrolase [Deltaproteobacteria bacterium]|nr:MAG: MBL fold metallo-hydrolase [Deltaproteobacteria bacterium]